MAKYNYKVLLLGAPAVGKTSILYRFVRNQFSENYITTIGINFLTKQIKPDEKNIANLVVWDIAGHEKFRFLHKRYYEGTNGALVIFDLTRKKTFQEIEEWVSEMLKILQKEVPFVIIGNKSDLLKDIDRSIDFEVARDYAEKKDSIYIETSAKTGEKIEDAFKELARRMIAHS